LYKESIAYEGVDRECLMTDYCLAVSQDIEWYVVLTSQLSAVYPSCLYVCHKVPTSPTSYTSTTRARQTYQVSWVSAPCCHACTRQNKRYLVYHVALERWPWQQHAENYGWDVWEQLHTYMCTLMM